MTLRATVDGLDRLLACFDEDELEALQEAVLDGADTVADAMGLTSDVLNTIEHTALTFYRSRVYRKAGLLYALLLRFDHKRSSAWRGLGACMQANKLFYEAAIAYEAAWELDNNDIPSLVFLGEAIVQAGEREKGLGLLREAVDRGTDIPDYMAYITRARTILQANGEMPPTLILRQAGQALAREVDDLDQRSLQIDDAAPAAPEKALMDMSWSEMKEIPELGQALERIEKGMREGRISPWELAGFTQKHFDGVYACAYQYIQGRQHAKGLKLLAGLMILDPLNSRYYQLAGVACHQLKNYDPAEYFYAMAVAFDSEDALSTAYLGEVQVLSGSVEKGRKHLREGLELAQKQGKRDIVARAQKLLRNV